MMPFDSVLTMVLQGYWQGKIDGISVNGATVISSQDVVIDTGTNQVFGDTKSIQAIYDQIPGSQSATDGSWNSMSMSCLTDRSTD